MVPDVEPMAFASWNIGGELVGNVPIAGLLSKLDAGAPYGGWIFGSELRFCLEKERKRSQWGSIPRKSSQKWMKMAM
jgi:hypothetical protein